MNLLRYFVCCFICLNAALMASEDEFYLTCETFSPSKVKNTEEYQCLDSFDSGYYKTIIKMQNLPHQEKFAIAVNRPVFDRDEYKREKEFSREQAITNGRAIGEKDPIFVISSRGFLPGEKINVFIESEKGKHKTRVIQFIPQPIRTQNQGAEVAMTAELVAVSPTSYMIHLEGFNNKEKLRFVSRSFDEEIDHDFIYDEKNAMSYMPGVVGVDGGLGEIKIIREKGEQVRLILPWGRYLQPYLKGEVLGREI